MKRLILLGVLAFGLLASAQDITWMSTQFTPIAEGEFVRSQILAPFAEETGISVELLNVCLL